MHLQRALLLALVSIGACAAPVPEPLAPEQLLAMVREALQTAQTGATLVGRMDLELEQLRAHDRTQRPSSGLADRLSLLDAVCEDDRSQRVDLLERLEQRTDDPWLARTITGILEQDDAYLAAALDRDRVYSWFANLFNGLVQMGYAALNGNPIGVLKPIFQGVEEVLDENGLDARDRKQLALHRRWLAKYRDGRGLPEGAERIELQVREFEQQIFEEERLLIERLFEEGRLDAAAAHVQCARSRQVDREVVQEFSERLNREVEARREALIRGLDVEPMEAELARGTVRFSEPYRRWVNEILLGQGSSGDGFRALTSEAEHSARDDLLEVVTRAEQRLLQRPDLEAPIARARVEYSTQVRGFIFTGRRIPSDPLRRYQVARMQARRSVLDVLEAVFWVPATLFRAVHAAVGNPVDDRPIIDALALHVWSSPEGEHRRPALQELLERYERRGETQKALGAAKLLGLDEELVAELEEDLAAGALRRSAELRAGAARRMLLEAIVGRFPETEAARDAQEELTEMAGNVYTGALVIPAGAALSLADELGIRPELLDGRAENGEVESPGLRFLGDRVMYELVQGGVRERQSIAVEGDLRRRMQALAEEWSWRRRAAVTATYRELHQGVPVELKAGIGLSGIGIYPRLLPEEYRSRDRKLFE